MAFVNIFNLPANGYQVYVPETNYSTRPYTGLEDTVKELVIHRQGNPRFGWPTDEGSVRAWVLNSVEARLRAMPGGAGMQWLVQDSPPPDPSFLLPRRQSQPPRAVVERNVVAGVEPAPKPKSTMPGISTLISWLGDGLKPVEQAKADARASVCARCPANVELEGIQKAIGTVGDILHSIAEVKNHMKLSTPHDSHLKQCRICFCVLSTKVFSPIEHVKKGMPKEMFDRLEVPCWIRNELAGNEPT